MDFARLRHFCERNAFLGVTWADVYALLERLQ